MKIYWCIDTNGIVTSFKSSAILPLGLIIDNVMIFDIGGVYYGTR